ncbi:MAG: glycosyltransferase family 4 protein [Deltaproteobacteria bacterium]|nr:glycosyltransferase family 4 protein [Deltaproteobacteria bacterium]
MGSVLQLLCQRPALTGSGVTLDALVRHGSEQGWQQRVVIGVPPDDRAPAVGDLPADCIHPLVFESEQLPFPVAGMSDVMPYPSTRFSQMTAAQLAQYRDAWSAHLRALIGRHRPDLLHCHHVWLLAAIARRVAPNLPLVVHCHATGLRQIETCPNLAQDVLTTLAKADHFVVLHGEHRRQLQHTLGIEAARISVVGAGFRTELFSTAHALPDSARQGQLIYVGKLSDAKGVPQLLEAFARLQRQYPQARLHVVGSGSGPQAEAITARARALGEAVVLHGRCDQAKLAELLGRAAVCVLPSFYEGLPLVLAEAYACGCRLVCTALDGVIEQLAPRLGDALDLVDPPTLCGVDQPEPSALPAFVDRLAAAMDSALARGPLVPDSAILASFSWGAVAQRVMGIWSKLIG